MIKESLKTAAQMHAVITELISSRNIIAKQSEYDWKVCVRAVGVARDVFDSVPVEGNANEYGQAVLVALEPVYESYNDPDGEFTSGKSSIGDVYFDISNLLKSLEKAKKD